MIVLSHMPFWVWYLIIGIVIGLVLIYYYRGLPKWIRLGMFVLTIPLWWLTLIIWIAYEVIVKSKSTKGT